MCGGGGGDILAEVITVAVVVVAVVQPELIPALGAYMMGASPEVVAGIMATETAAGATAAATAAGYGSASLVGATAVGAVEGAVIPAVEGKGGDAILKGAATGGASGAIGSTVGSAIGGTTGGEQAGPFLDSAGNVVPGPVTPPSGVAGATGSQFAGNVAGAGGSGFTKGFTSAELGGSNLNQALRQGEIQGATGALTEAAFGTPTNTADALAKSAGGAFIGQDVSSLFTPQRSAGITGSSGDLPSYQGSVATTGQQGPGSSALGQALRIGDPGAPIESPGGGEKSSAPVWNIASLRTKDETGG